MDGRRCVGDGWLGHIHSVSQVGVSSSEGLEAKVSTLLINW